MRESLTVLAILLTLVLAAAFAGPHFIDWTAQRPLIEAKLGEALGHRVRLDGAIDVRLLPSPRLQLGRIDMPNEAGEPEFSARSLTVELETMPLLRGEMRFVEAAFGQPVLHVVLDKEGRLILPRLSHGIGRETRIDRLVLADATLLVDDQVSGQTLALGGLQLQAEAASLDGPFKGAGQAMRANGPVAFRFSTGTADHGKMRIKAIVDAAADLPRMEADGVLFLGQDGDQPKPAGFEGAVGISGQVTMANAAATRMAWKLSGQVLADIGKVQASALELRLGEEETAFVTTGQGGMVLGARPELSLTLTARQIDLDRLAGGGDGGAASVAMMGALQGLIADPDAATRLPFALKADFAYPAVTLGGETLTDVAGQISLVPGQPIGLKLSGGGPGRSLLELDGALETGAASGFKGQLHAATRESGRLADWLAVLAPDAAAWLRAAPFRAIDIVGLTQLSAVGVSGADLQIKLDRSALTGAVAFTRAVWTDRARLFADVSSPALDLDAAPDLATALRGSGDMDLAIVLEAHAVKVARFGQGMIDAGHISAKLVKTGAETRLERLAIDNLGGASLAATGTWTGGSGRLDASIDAARLGDVTDLLRRIAPGTATEALAARAAALSPARITLACEAAASAAQAGLSLTRLSLAGMAGATQITASLGPDASKPGIVIGTISLDAPETGVLLRQLGVEAAAATGTGRGRISASLNGNPETTLQAGLDATLAGTHLAYRGTLAGSLAEPLLRGTFKLDSANLSPLAQALAMAVPDFGAGLPASLTGDAEASPARLTLANLAGTLAGARLEGGLSLLRAASAGLRAKLSGELRLDHLAVPVLPALALGRPLPAAAGTVWADAKFASGLVDPPDTQLALAIASLDVAGVPIGRNATVTLGLAPGKVALEGISFQAGEGRVHGDVTLRRDGANASVAGAIGFEALAIGLPSLVARASGTLDFTATGTSASTLAGAMAGIGHVTLSGIQVPRADAGAIAAVLALADAHKLTVEEGEMKRTLARELDRGATSIADQAYDLTAAAGTVRLNPVASDGPMKLGLDLRNLTLDQRLVQTIAASPKDWEGSLPHMEVTFKGPVAAPARDVEAGNFINGIAAREIARDTARIAALDADIRERAAFNRRLKADRQSRQNEISLQRFLDEEEARRKAEEARRVAEETKARLLEAAKAEREKRAADEARRKADDIARKQAADPQRLVPADASSGAAPAVTTPQAPPPDAATRLKPTAEPNDPARPAPF